MTDAGKALDRIEQTGFIDLSLTREIRNALQRAEKTQGLVKALTFYKKHAAKHSLDGICNCPTRKVAAEAIAAFKSDERGTT